jgi:hypothetical protein
MKLNSALSSFRNKNFHFSYFLKNNFELLEWRRKTLIATYCHCIRNEKKIILYAVVIFMKIFCVDEFAGQNQAAEFAKHRNTNLQWTQSGRRNKQKLPLPNSWIKKFSVHHRDPGSITG